MPNYCHQVFAASFGNGGFRTTRMGPGFRAQHNHRQANTEPRSAFLQFLPLLILFGFSLLSALPNLFATPPIPDPRASFSPSQRYNVPQETPRYGVKYYVNPNEFMNHPTIGPELVNLGIDLKQQTEPLKFKRGPMLSKFEAGLESLYKQDLYSRCELGMERKERAKQAEIGLFGFGADWDKVRKIQAEPVKECEEGKTKGFWR